MVVVVFGKGHRGYHDLLAAREDFFCMSRLDLQYIQFFLFLFEFLGDFSMFIFSSLFSIIM